MGGKCREWDGKAWVAQGGAFKMIYILWKFILSGGGVRITWHSLGGTRGRSLDDLYTLKVYFIGGRRAFSQPEGLFEWDIDAFHIRC